MGGILGRINHIKELVFSWLNYNGFYVGDSFVEPFTKDMVPSTFFRIHNVPFSSEFELFYSKLNIEVEIIEDIGFVEVVFMFYSKTSPGLVHNQVFSFTYTKDENNVEKLDRTL